MPNPSPDTDRNLLFGVLALQADLIDPARFAEACSAWAVRKDKPLADLLVERGWLTPADRADVDKLLDRKLRKHDGDARAGLAEATTSELLHKSLTGVSDPDVLHSLGGTPLLPAPVAFPTQAYLPRVRDRYTLNHLHATGGVGRVWLAHDPSLGRDVALKEVRPDRAGHPAIAARFLKEACITGQLEHPGIVPIYEVGRRGDDEPPFYTMRFVRGRTLSEAVAAYHQHCGAGAAGPLELRELLAAFVAVCNTVAYAHSRGVLHRDLKPSNVILGDYGEVIVLDWGLARLLGQSDSEQAGPVVEADRCPGETVQGQVLGTPAYMAPEQAQGRLDLLGPASDVYGLGSILFTILTGRPPFAGSGATPLLRRVVHDEPPRPRSLRADVPAPLEAVCLKALAKQPQARYASAKDLAGEVQRFLADEPVTAYREPWPVRAARWARRRRSLVVGTAVFLLSAVVALSVGTGLIWHEQRRTAAQKLEAEQERDRAQRNFHAARQLSIRLIDIAEQKIAPLPHSAPVRAELLQAAVGTFRPFLADRPDDLPLQEHVALLHRYLANVQRLLGEAAVAEQSYRESLRLWEELNTSGNATPFRRIHLAETLRDYAGVQARLGKLVDATASARRAVEVATTLRASAPMQPGYHRLVAMNLHGLAERQYARGRFREAEESCREVVRLCLALLAAPRGRPERFDQLLVAIALTHLGACQRQLGQHDAALGFCAEAVKHLRRMVVAQADDDARHFLNLALVEQGRTLARVPARRAEAEAGLNEAVEHWQDLSGRFRQVPLYQESHAIALQIRGEWLTGMERPGAAQLDLDRSRSLLEGLTTTLAAVPGYRGHLGRTYGALGRLAAARGNAREAATWFARAVESLRRGLDQDKDHAINRLSLEEFEAELRRHGG
jgi:tetratricopeptide (TPR) repeat protein